MSESRIDPELVKSLLGKHVLVGITYYSSSGELEGQRQFHGRIVEINENSVQLTHPESGEIFSLPPDLSSYQKANPGEYRLRESGEIVVNPDLLATWTVTRPAK